VERQSSEGPVIINYFSCFISAKILFSEETAKQKAPSFSFIIQKISTFVPHNNYYQKAGL